MPEKFEIPDEQIYLFMIWSLAKYYRLSPGKAAKMREIDFWQTVKFEELEQAKNLYFLKLKQEN